MPPHQDAVENQPRALRLDGLLIRAARPTDAEEVAALANLPGYRYGTLRMPFQTVEETRKHLENLGPSGKSMVADIDGKIVANIFIGPFAGRRRHSASIGMGVHDDFTGRGIGRALMNVALDIADNWLDIRRIELTVFTDNESAIRLYENNGFVKEGHFIQFAFRDGAYVDAYSMARMRT